MNTLPRLRNRYFALRHGSSEANARGIIVSDPRTGEEAFGLTAAGRAEVRDAIAGWHEGVALIVSSPFRRARESAAIARTVLGSEAPLVIDARLRERHFGALEGQSAARYEEIWNADAADPCHCRHGAEAAAAVRSPCARVAIRASPLCLMTDRATSESAAIASTSGSSR